MYSLASECRPCSLSSGEFAGRFVEQTPAITVMAIEMAVSGMTIGLFFIDFLQQLI